MPPAEAIATMLVRKACLPDVAVGRPMDVSPKPERCERVDADGRSLGFSKLMTAMGGRATEAATENGWQVFLPDSV